MPITRKQVEQALAIVDFDVSAAHSKMAPVSRMLDRSPELGGAPRLGGVLLLIFPKRDALHILLTRRRDDLPSHAGQISFPGGRNEAPESLLDTALRETEEEVGLGADGLDILGALQPIYIPPSDYRVHSFVAWYDRPAPPNFTPAPHEVAEIIEVPLSTLLDPASRREELWQRDTMQLIVPYFFVQGHKVWGATAIMLSEFVERLRLTLV